MFSICPKKVYQNKDLSALDIRVYLAIQGFANDDGFCFPSVSRIADECGISRRAVFYSLAKLESCKVIAREKRMRDDGGYSSNGYYLKLEPESDVQEIAQGGVQYGALPSAQCCTSNKNQITKNINIKFIQQRARARVKGRNDDSAVPVVDMVDVNDVLSCCEEVKQAKMYSFFKAANGVLGFRPLMASMQDAITEHEITSFFESKCNREIVLFGFHQHTLHEVTIEI